MNNFELIPHTADVRILARGDTFPDLLITSLDGLCEVLYPGYKQSLSGIEPCGFMEVCSDDETALLIDFLSDVLTLMYKKRKLIPHVELVSLNEKMIKARLSGYNIEEFVEEVKAVTYHEAEITRNENNEMQTIIVLDI